MSDRRKTVPALVVVTLLAFGALFGFARTNLALGIALFFPLLTVATVIAGFVLDPTFEHEDEVS